MYSRQDVLREFSFKGILRQWLAFQFWKWARVEVLRGRERERYSIY